MTSADLTSSGISDAQIDPALLEAVVTVLRHVDETQKAAQVEAEAQGGQRLMLDGDHSIKVPPRTRQSRRQADGEENTTAPAKRTRRKKSNAGTDGEASSQGPRRRRSTTRATDGPEDEDGGSPRRRKRARRSRVPSPPPFDPDADPGEEIDPTAVTMAELCDDIGRGRVSSKAAQIVSNHTTWRAVNREKRARQRAIAEAKKYGRNLEEEETNPSQPVEKSDPSAPSATDPSSTSDPTVGAEEEDATGQKGDDYDYTQSLATSRFNVQVRIGANGETVIDETSLFVDRQEEDETANYTHIEESDTSKFVNSSTYSKKLRGSRWSAEETELFYDVRD